MTASFANVAPLRGATRRNIYALSPKRLPPADVSLLADFGRAVAAGVIPLDPMTVVKYSLRYRRFLFSLFQSAANRLALAPAERFTVEALRIHRDELLKRLDAYGVAEELRYLNCARAYLLPGVDRDIIADVVDELIATSGATTPPAVANQKVAPLNLSDAELARDYPELIEKLRAALPVVDGRRVARLSEASVKHARQHLCEYLGALKRRAPAMTKATTAALFSRDAVAVWVADIQSRAPEAAAGRVTGLRQAAMRIDPASDYAWMATLAAELAAGHPSPNRQPPSGRPTSPSLPEVKLPKADRDMLDRCSQNYSAEAQAEKWAYWGKKRWDTLRHAYCSYLGAIERVAPSLVDGPILARFVPEVVELAIEDLRSSCNDKTIADRLRDIKRLLERAFPDAQLDWLTERAHDLVRFRRRKTRTIPIVPVLDLVRSGFATMDGVIERLIRLRDAPTLFSLRPLAEQYRNALMMTWMALMAPRSGALASLRLGTTISRRENGYHVEYVDTKNGTIDPKDVPGVLTHYIDVYVRLIISLIFPDAPAGVLWISSRGDALSQSGIEKILPPFSLETTGVRIAQHGYRYIVATTAAEFVEVDPRLASQLLHHLDQSVTETFYIKSGRKAAQRDLADALEERLAALMG
jgi:hypothetical protein